MAHALQRPHFTVVCIFQFGVLTTFGEHWQHAHLQPYSGFLGAVKTEKLHKELRHAIRDALGNGDELEVTRMNAIKAKLNPMWQSLVKNVNGKIDLRSLLYALQRYMHKSYHVSFIGLELGMNDTSKPAAIMSHAPELVRNIVHGNITATDGFQFEDLVAMVAMCEQLLMNSGSDMLRKVYESSRIGTSELLPRERVNDVLENYLLYWLFTDDPVFAKRLIHNTHLRVTSLGSWAEMAQFMRGLAQSFEYKHEQDPRAWQAESWWNPMRRSFSFEDVNAIAGDLLLSYGDFWRSECMSVRNALIKLDYYSTGRVKLSHFYGASLDGEWRFGESEEYLRQMGALDESSTHYGPRVIVPNYLQGPSNCIVSDLRYRVCCPNDCENYMAEIEDAVASAIASPEQLLQIVSSITTTADDDKPTITSPLRSQLSDIAHLHQGKIPIHGRLFAQWLHYVFPRDCPFPHKSGTIVKLSPNQFGDESLAQDEEKKRHSQQDVQFTNESGVFNSDDWMTQWSEEEEILIGGFDLKAPWEIRLNLIPRWISVALLGGVAGALAMIVRPGSDKVNNCIYTKEHFV